MAKWLISADWHIGNYANYNYEAGSRLNQYPVLASRIVDIAKDKDCHDLLILGDFIDIPVNIPEVQIIAKECLDILKGYFDNIYFIKGQHDKYSKANNDSYKDSILSMFIDDKFQYMNHKFICTDGNVFGFQDWTPDQDTSWITDKVTVLFGHYTKSTLFGQEIDESKFKLMIHGDIHNKQEIGQFISVGNPIQRDMSSDAEGDVLVFDTKNCSWERVLTDPDHSRFLQMAYTDDPNQEGFHGPLQYLIYKPVIKLGESDTTSKSVTWNDIDELIHNRCKEFGLDDIQSEVESKCIPYSEIDFNFQLTYLKIHGYRSVVDFEINFKDRERIALLGKNGSGKSSIINALRGIFLKNSELKWEQSDFTDDVVIKVGILYQNKLYEITKGSQWGLTIDGSQVNYNNLTEFQNDLPVKLPFINYLDLFFVSSETSSLSKQFTPTRRIELISKFYRLDRINAYYETAQSLYNELNQPLWETKSELSKQTGILEHCNERKAELEKDLKDLNKDDILSELQGYKDIRSKYQARQLWLRDDRNLYEKLQECKKRVDDINSNLTFDLDEGEAALVRLTAERKAINEKYEQLYKDAIEFDNNVKLRDEYQTAGSQVAAELKKIDEGKCPACGAPLAVGDAKEIRETYNKKLGEYRIKWSEVDDKIQNAPSGELSKDWYKKALITCKSKYDSDGRNIELLNNKITSYKKDKAALENEIKLMNEAQKKYDDNKKLEPEEVKLPLEIDEKESKANSNLYKFQEYQDLLREIERQTNKVNEIQKSIDDLDDKMSRYTKYMELTSLTGLIYEDILRQLALKFSTSEVKYDVDAGVYRNARYISFNSYYKVKGKYRLYEKCSAGQKIVCDLDFLNKLFSMTVGLLVLDEMLRYLDEDNFPNACEILKDMKVNTLMLSTHDSTLTVYTKRVLLKLDDEGKTVGSII